MAASIRPTKKQRELLSFIEAFIAEHGYSPSYREIMNGCSYTSVATVALHINSLVARGHLVKRPSSARSLEVIRHQEAVNATTAVDETKSKWLIDEVGKRLDAYEQAGDDAVLDEVYVLLGALKVLGLEDAMRSFLPRLPRK